MEEPAWCRAGHAPVIKADGSSDGSVELPAAIASLAPLRPVEPADEDFPPLEDHPLARESVYFYLRDPAWTTSLPEAELPKLKTIFWRNNIVGFAPFLEIAKSGIHRRILGSCLL